MEERRDEYGFCPKCGAVMQNGVCQSCGYGNKFSMGGHSAAQGNDRQNFSGKKKKSASTRIAVVLGIVLLVLLAVFAGLTIRAVVENKEDSSSLHIGEEFFDDFNTYEEDEFEEWYEDYEDDGIEEYIPGPGDEYYRQLADAVVQGLSYEVEWDSVSRYPDEDSRTEYYSATCPLVYGGEEELMEKVNSRIRDIVFRYRDSYRDYEYGTDSVCYVTYMDEERLSLAVEHTLYAPGKTEYLLDAVNFDMTNGEIIPYGELIQADEELVKKFRSQNSVQNTPTPSLDEMTDEELLQYLSDDETRVAFYTPVGIEFGFNYEEGWVIVTMKDEAL